MRTIRFTNETTREEGARIIVTSGLVEYTGKKGVFRVPDYVLGLLDESEIPYEVIKSNNEAIPSEEWRKLKSSKSDEQ